ncbi:11511_t:CDS:2, partial [Gigaspora rosea]
RLSKEKTVEFITNIIDSDSETSIYSENLVEFITNVDDYSETSICLEDFVLSNDSDHQSMLFENISTLFKNKNTYDEEGWIKIKLENGLIQSFDYTEFSDVNEIGEGMYNLILNLFNAVYSAEYRGAKIAFKMFKDANIRKIVNELKKRHMTVNYSENIIRFLGITVVLQYANGGTLRSYLRSKINENIFIISRAEIILITKQIISGLQSLHDNKVIHRNLNPENILIVRDDNMASIYEKSFNIAIDFGSADDSLTSAFSTIEYEDLQFLINTRGPTCKSDIYSLEVILCELTSGIRPYSKYNNKFVLAYYISKGLREKIIPGMPSSYSRLYKKCWSTNPKKRPELQKILHEIHKIQQNGKDIYKDISNEIPHVHC